MSASRSRATRSLSALLLLGLAALAQAAWARVENLAVFIGVDEGLAQDRSLKYAARDAQRMAEVMRELGAFDKDRIYLLSNPTLDRIHSALEEIRGRVKELRKAGVQTQILLYYSGHGSAEGLHVRGRRFRREEVNDLVESLESDLKIVILDACESGDFLRRKGGRIVEDREIVKLDRLRSQGTIVLSSSSRGELAQESEDYKGAVFSHHLINGLRGLADYNADGNITLLEAFEYARVSTRREEIHGRGGAQNPSFDFDVVGESDPVLARLERSRSRIRLRGMPAVALEVYNAQSLDLEHRVWMTGKDGASFFLPSGRFLLRYSESGDWRVRPVDLTWTSEVTVSPAEFRPQGRTLLTRKGGVTASLDAHGLQLSSRRAGPVMAAPLFGAEYVFRSPLAKQTLGLQYGRERSAGAASGVEVDTDLFRLGYAVQAPLIAFTYFQVQAGLEAAWHRALQTARDTRFGSQPPRVDGRPLRTRWEAEGNVLEGGIPVGVEAYFPGRVWLGLAATASAYRFRDAATGSRVWRWAVAPGLTLGHQF